LIQDSFITQIGFALTGERDLRKFNNGLKQAERQVDVFTAGLNKLAIAAASAFAGLAIGQKLGRFVSDITKTGAAFEGMGVRLKALEGSAAGAEKALGWISQFAKKTPLELAEVTDAYARLRAYGLDPTDGSLLAITDTMAATGGGAEKLNGIITALGQAWTKQKLQGEESMQLMERGVNVWDLLAKATGKTPAALMKLSEAGKLGRREIRLLIEEMGAKFAGASEEYSKTFAGITSNLKDNWTHFLKGIADSGYFNDVKYRLQGLLDWVNRRWDDGTFERWTTAISDGLVAGMETAEALGRAAWRIGRGFYYAADAVLTLGSKISGLNKTWVGLGLGAAALGTRAWGRAAMLALARKVPWVGALLLLEDIIVGLEDPDSSLIGSTEGGKNALETLKKNFEELKTAIDEFAGTLNEMFGINGERGKHLEAFTNAFGEWASGELVRFVNDLTKALQDVQSVIETVTWALQNSDEAWKLFGDKAIEQIDRIVDHFKQKWPWFARFFDSGAVAVPPTIQSEPNAPGTPPIGRSYPMTPDADARREDLQREEWERLQRRRRQPAFGAEGARSMAGSNPMLDLIGRAEGTDRGRGYNETLAYGAFTGGNVNLTSMTLDDIDALQKRMLRHPDNNFNSSALGRYQIVRKTLLGLRKELGLSGDEKFTPELQDRLAKQLLKRRGRSISGLRNEWQGLRRVSADEILGAWDHEHAPRRKQAGMGVPPERRATMLVDPAPQARTVDRAAPERRATMLVEPAPQARTVDRAAPERRATRFAQSAPEVRTPDRAALERAATMLANYQGNVARLGNSAAATQGTLVSRNQQINNHITTTVNQTVQQAVQAPGAVANAVGSAASGRAQQVARIAAEPAARP
jgi:tape measure domain-containing protein